MVVRVTVTSLTGLESSPGTQMFVKGSLHVFLLKKFVRHLYLKCASAFRECLVQILHPSNFACITQPLILSWMPTVIPWDLRNPFLRWLAVLENRHTVVSGRETATDQGGNLAGIVS